MKPLFNIPLIKNSGKTITFRGLKDWKCIMDCKTDTFPENVKFIAECTDEEFEIIVILPPLYEGQSEKLRDISFLQYINDLMEVRMHNDFNMDEEYAYTYGLYDDLQVIETLIPIFGKIPFQEIIHDRVDFINQSILETKDWDKYDWTQEELEELMRKYLNLKQ